MKTIFKAFGLTILLVPVAAQAADYGFGPQICVPARQRVVIERPLPVVTRDITIERRIVAPQPHQTRIIERKIVQGPGGVVKTTRIYERYSKSAPAPIPPRDIPLASAHYPAPGIRQTYIGPSAAGFVGSQPPFRDEWDDDDLE